MPTGYTSRIIDGSITNFKEYAILCTRAFGAAMHERDDSFTTKAVKLREPSKYHMDVLKGLEKEKMELEKISDKTLVDKRKADIMDDVKRYQDYITKAEKAKERLLAIRIEVEAWNPPTDEHQRYKEFMLEQLDVTIKSDGDSTYWEGELAKSSEKLLESFDPAKERERKRLDYEEQFKYHTEAYEKEVKSCNAANEWLQSVYRTL